MTITVKQLREALEAWDDDVGLAVMYHSRSEVALTAIASDEHKAHLAGRFSDSEITVCILEKLS